ncbi:hypothetical protein D3C72_1661030 [compost metagenome]
MHHAGGSANLGIGIGGDLFLDEVDKARLALHQAQQLQGCGVGRHLNGLFHQLLDGYLDALFHGLLDDFFHGHFHADFDDLLDRDFYAHFLGLHIGGQGLAAAQAADIARQTAVAENGEETADRNGDAAEKGWGGVVHESTNMRPHRGPGCAERSGPPGTSGGSESGMQGHGSICKSGDFTGCAYVPAVRPSSWRFSIWRWVG